MTEPDRIGVGASIDAYEIIELLGEGAFGSVYRARQAAPLKRDVALKILKLGMDTKQVIARFEAERQALAMMDHPSIARVLDAGATESGRPYFVMELVKGVPITDYCDEHRLVPRQRLELFIKVCAAVQHAHQKGIIHRDLKPSNVMVASDNGVPSPKVIDFGIAKAVHGKLTDSTLYTEYSQFIGTPTYMSPEQAGMPGLDIDTRSDIYSLGVLLYELLTGATPFDATTLKEVSYDEIQRAIRFTEPMKPSTRLSTLGDKAVRVARHRGVDTQALRRRLKRDLDWITMKALEKDRSRRYETANGLAMDIGRYLRREPVVAGPPDTIYRVRKFVQRHRAGATAGALVALALVAGLAFASIGFMRASEERDAVKQARDESEAVTAFLTGMLAAVSPGQQGRDVTVRQVLDVASSTMDEDYEDTPLVEARLRDAIGRAYRKLGLYDASTSHMERVLQIQLCEKGPEHGDTLSAMNNLAVGFRKNGRYADAEPLYVKVLDIRRRTLGNDHAKTVTSMNNLSLLYKHQGRWDEAEPLMLETLERITRLLGEEHRNTLTTMNNLAGLYMKQGRYEEAEPLMGKILDLRRRTLGAEHPDVIISMNNRAFLLRRQGRYEDAEPVFRQALELSLSVFGERHPETLRIRQNLCILLLAQGRYEEMEPLAAETLEERIQLLGEEHPDTLKSMSSLGSMRHSQGRYEDARSLHMKTFEIRRRVLGEKHPDTLSSMCNLGSTELQLGRNEEAVQLLERGVELRRAVLGDGHPDLIDSLKSLINACELVGKPEKAEKYSALLHR